MRTIPASPPFRFRIRPWLLGGTLLFLVASCATRTEFNLVPVPEALDLTASDPAMVVKLQRVIVPNGPGTWMTEARWDEYVITLTARSPTPCTVVSVRVIDSQGTPQPWGETMEELNVASRAIWKLSRKAGIAVFPDPLPHMENPYHGTRDYIDEEGHFYKAGDASFPFFVLAAAIDLKMYWDPKQKEMDRRRLALPRVLAPNESVTGSVFFPLIPAPRRLVVRAMTATGPVEIAIELTPLAGLHLNPQPPAPLAR